MRTLFFLALIVVGLVVAGVLTVQKSGDNINIHVDQNRLQQVEKQAAQIGGNLLEQAEKNLQNAGNQPAGQTR
ncbi:MAG: hypothetical protein JSS27_06690 [Planctomycetes bacterium]|nr:hypothetical protein [Planctomycetota bacterium]